MFFGIGPLQRAPGSVLFPLKEQCGGKLLDLVSGLVKRGEVEKCKSRMDPLLNYSSSQLLLLLDI